MIKITSNNIVQAYLDGFDELLSDKNIIQNDPKIYCEANALFELFSDEELPKIQGDSFITDFDYDKYRVNGNQQAICEFDYYSDYILKNGQLKSIINMLSNKPHTKQAIITLPKKNRYKMPCMMYMCLRVTNGFLNGSAHMRANNAYGILLMNMFINYSIVNHAAQYLSLKRGSYVHVIDSYHIYKREIDEINLLQKEAAHCGNFHI